MAKYPADAACKDKWYMFESFDEDSTIVRYVDLSFSERFYLEEYMHQVAENLCFGCPVLQECRDAATTEDFQFTIRAGFMPNVTLRNKVRGKFPQCEHEPEGFYRCDDCFESAMIKAQPWLDKLDARVYSMTTETATAGSVGL